MSYDPQTGILAWNPRPEVTVGDRIFNVRFAGKSVGTTKNSTGYVNVRYAGRMYTAHRLVWLYVHGAFPRVIDHIDRDKTNNRLSNLRLVTPAQNNFNRLHGPTLGARKSSNGRWRATISVGGKTMHLGIYDRVEDAMDAYRSAAVKFYGFEPITGAEASS